MPITRIADVIQPEIFTAYTLQRTMELSELIQSGIAVNSAEWDALASGPNTLINMPYWEDLTGDPDVMDDTGHTTPGKVTTNKDVARKLAFTKSFGANALAAVLAGADPMTVIGDRFAAYWQRFYQQLLLSTLDGVFASTSMAGKIHDISVLSGNAAIMDASSTLDAIQLMGDAKDQLTALMVNSAVENHMAKNNLIEYIQESEARPRVPYYSAKRVIVDDSMPYDASGKLGVMYLFGAGAIAWGNGTHPSIQQTEVVRDGMSLAGEDVLVNRRIPLLHPRGVKWNEASITSDEGQFPEVEDLENGDNWTRVYEPKAIRIVKFVFKIN